MSRSGKNKSGKKHAGTQTQEIDTTLEIARLQEQVKLLKIENDVLRKYKVDKPADSLKVTPPESSSTNKKVTPENDVGVAQHKEVQNAQSVTKMVHKSGLRGCSCKGNCASKICGCVKKDLKCTDACRCNNTVCHNQEQKDIETNKENVETTNIEISDKTIPENKRVLNKHLQHVEGRSLFSPNVEERDTTVNVEEFRPMSISFGNPKKLMFGSDEENEKEEVKKTRKRTGKGNEKEPTRTRGRPKKKTLEVNNAEHTQKMRSPNEEQTKKPDTIDRSRMENAYPSTDTETQSDGDNAPPQREVGNYLKNIMQGMVSIRNRKQKITEVNEVENHKTSEHNVKKKNDRSREKAVINSDTLTNKNIEIPEVKNNEQQTDISISNSTTDTLSEQKDFNKTTSSQKSMSSESDFHEDSSFDPTKPTRQLPRTPVHSGTESNLNTSDMFLPLPVYNMKEEDEVEEYSLSAELQEAEVDWEEYQSQLVACGKCKRTFHPRRIKKHERCCKKM